MFYTVLSILLESWLILVFLTCNCDDAMNYIFEHLPMDVEWRSLMFWSLAAILNYIFFFYKFLFYANLTKFLFC